MKDTRRTRIVLALLLLSAFTFITLDARSGDDSVLDKIRSGAQAVFGPIERGAATVVRPVSDFIDGLTSINANQETIDTLEAENEALQRELLSLEYYQSRVEELDKLLNISGLGRYEVLPAQVIAFDTANGYVRAVTIDAGTRDQLTEDMTVINGDGLVGRVINVSTSTADVLLLSDPTFTAGARLAGNLEAGFVTGNGPDPLSLELLDVQADVEKGDLLVTRPSLHDRPFVAGVPIGEVTDVTPEPGALTRPAKVEPFADLTALDLVGVIVEPPRTDPRDSVLPDPPSPTPTGSTTPLPPVSPTPTPTTTGTRQPSPSTSP